MPYVILFINNISYYVFKPPIICVYTVDVFYYLGLTFSPY
jgi:hypothetical protein